MQSNTEQSAVSRKRTILDNLLTRQEFCEQYGFNYRTVEGWAHRGEGPRCTRLGGRVYYHVDDIAEWVEAQRKKTATRFAKSEA